MRDVTNSLRAHWAAVSLREFMNLTGSDIEDALCDLLGDLMHWADQNGFDFGDELRRGQDHFQAESLEESITLSATDEGGEL